MPEKVQLAIQEGSEAAFVKNSIIVDEKPLRLVTRRDHSGKPAPTAQCLEAPKGADDPIAEMVRMMFSRHRTS